MQREEAKQQIEARFNEYVKGLKPRAHVASAHDGLEGDWLTRRMGLEVNGNNEPDFLGFEMKKDSKGKTSFGDWSPNSALYKSSGIDRDDFLNLFGSPNPLKGDRYSWSGSVFPKVDRWNEYGQRLFIDQENNITARYRHSMNRVSADRMPIDFHIENLELAFWSAEPIGAQKGLRSKVEDKFNVFGWFRCLKDAAGFYSRLQFGGPVTFADFMTLFRSGEIFIDCGMYEGNPRPYMHFRANNTVWDLLAE